jgi:chromosome segregation ATPase
MAEEKENKDLIALQTKLSEMESKLAHQQEEVNRKEALLVETQKKNKELENKSLANAEAGELKTKLQERESEVERLTKETMSMKERLESTTSEMTTLKNKITEAENSERAVLLSQISDESVRELYKNEPINSVKLFVQSITKIAGGTNVDHGRAVGNGANGELKWENMTNDEREKLILSDEPTADKLLKEYLSGKR